jgi:cold shock CspA family protein
MSQDIKRVRLEREQHEKQFDSMVKRLTADGIFDKVRRTGIIKTYRPAGYGFIKTPDGEYYFHISSYSGNGEPSPGEEVYYIPGKRKGKPTAFKVVPVQ